MKKNLMYGVIAAMSAWVGLSVAADDVAPVCNCPKTYLSASGGYVKNGDFEGAFGSARLGRIFCKSATRAMSIELEFNGLCTDANSSVFYPDAVAVLGGRKPNGCECFCKAHCKIAGVRAFC